MKTFSAAIAISILAASPVHAAWKIDSFKNRMTDKQTFYGIAPAKELASGISASLRIGCMNGAPLLSAEISAPLSRGQIGGVYRIDDGAPQSRIMRVFSDPNSVPFLDIEPAALSRAKRFRLQLHPTGSPALFFDFDVTGAPAVLAKVKC
jgi:hypothetical protein